MGLIDEIDKRKAESSKSQTSDSVYNDNSREETVELIKGYAIIMSFALYTVHFTLSGLAYKQYSQDFSIKSQLVRSLPSILVFYLLMRTCHPLNTRIKQTTGLICSVACGAYLLFLVNTEGYHTMITKVPALGTIWIWLFIELEWYSGVVSLLITFLYAKINDLAII